MNKYLNRQDAGAQLAHYLLDYANNPNAIVLALPRGGVPVAYEIAQTLHLPLDIFVVRKLGVPGHAELAMGAIATGDTVVFNDSIIKQLQVSQDEIHVVIAKEKKELARRETAYRGDRQPLSIKGKTVILVDDGIATGASMHVAINALKNLDASHIVVAVPVAPSDVCDQLAPLVNEFICPMQPADFFAVGYWYDDFAQTEDDEVRELLSSVNY
jgi:predicted phosphoribosyltransferase